MREGLEPTSMRTRSHRAAIDLHLKRAHGAHHHWAAIVNSHGCVRRRRDRHCRSPPIVRSIGHHRDAAWQRRVHPSVLARTVKGARGGAYIPFARLARFGDLIAAQRKEKGMREMVLGSDTRGPKAVLFAREWRATIRSCWTDGDEQVMKPARVREWKSWRRARARPSARACLRMSMGSRLNWFLDHFQEWTVKFFIFFSV
jgi:hypothetical protein